MERPPISAVSGSWPVALSRKTLSTVFMAITTSEATTTSSRLFQMKERSINSPIDRKNTTRSTLSIGSITGITRERSVEFPTIRPPTKAP